MTLIKKAIITFAWLGLLSTHALSHELRPSVADIDVTPNRVHLTLYLMLEPIIAGIDLEGLSDTNESPLSLKHDALRAMPPKRLAAELRSIWPNLSELMSVKAGNAEIQMNIVGIEIPQLGNLDLPRDSVLILTGQLPKDGTDVSLSWGKGLGLLALRQIGENATYEVMLTGGESSDNIPRTGTIVVTSSELFMQYIKIGFQHIVPKGLDHILFVLGLFLFSAAFRPLIWQVSTFTIAHTITLAMASLGVVSVPASLVEPLIAVSITYVAIENIIGGKLGARRLVIVFSFGLLHGLGFASVLGDIGVQPERFLTGLFGFNLGVEFGQLAVIALAFLTVGIWFRNRKNYRKFVVIPGSILIGAIGVFWAIERVLF